MHVNRAPTVLPGYLLFVVQLFFILYRRRRGHGLIFLFKDVLHVYDVVKCVINISALRAHTRFRVFSRWTNTSERGVYHEVITVYILHYYDKKYFRVLSTLINMVKFCKNWPISGRGCALCVSSEIIYNCLSYRANLHYRHSV
jgi:hypothetical protein